MEDVSVVDPSTASGALLLARLDRIPVWPYPRSILAIVGAGFFFAYFDIVTIGFALPVLSKEFGVSAELASWGSAMAIILLPWARAADNLGAHAAHASPPNKRQKNK